jgi:hypothetical protein
LSAEAGASVERCQLSGAHGRCPPPEPPLRDGPHQIAGTPMAEGDVDERQVLAPARGDR